MSLRSPIVSVLGHVDHGKSSILDAVRGTNIIASEAGAITQAIGASIIPLEVIKKKCGALLESLKMELTIPGLLFIDTPGHAAFTNLRKRGGNLADIAIVVVDINDGLKPQTKEAIEILKNYKTPFILVANKIDQITGYSKKSDMVLGDIQQQSPDWITAFETKLYEIVGQLHDEFGMQAERFDRVQSYTEQVAIVPASALEKHGIAELLMVLVGLAQKFLEDNLNLNVDGPGKGTILEVKETQGFGTTIDVILYDGVLKKNDTIVIGGITEPIIAKVRAILEPNPLHEMRDKKAKYINLPEATAATGLRIAAPGLDDAIAGMPVRVAKNTAQTVKEIQEEVDAVLVQTDEKGIIIKADTIGSLEALSVLLREHNIPIRKASVGSVTKKDIADAASNEEHDPSHAVILGFNIPEETTDTVKIITSPVIYDLLDQLQAWQEELTKKQAAEHLETLTKPAKIEVLQNCIFRQSNPCVAGVEVLAGTLQTGTPLLNKDGKQFTLVKSIEKNKESIQELKKGEQAAISLPDVMAGRHVFEHDVYLSAITEDEFRAMKEVKNLLSPEEKELLKELAELHRQRNPLWGV
ncbi:MAG: translation initiation factor IF-2 [Candidatus Woesearchaeota archaeon]|nr:translation initiation factor IF-2 [Candidatus Woesearchaeota archaeon]